MFLTGVGWCCDSSVIKVRGDDCPGSDVVMPEAISSVRMCAAERELAIPEPALNVSASFVVVARGVWEPSGEASAT